MKLSFKCLLNHGYFLQTEIRQHTVLASVALAGGCYGLLTTIYILLFGMTRLTPWGLVHHIPVFISKHRHHDLRDKKYSQEENMYHQNEGPDERVGRTDNNMKKRGFSTSVLIPWFFRSSRRSDESFTSADVKEAIMTKMIVRNKFQGPEQSAKLTRVDSTELHLLDSDKRTSSSTGPAPSNCDKQYNDIPLSPQQHNGNTEILYHAPRLSSIPPALPPHYSMASSSSTRNVEITPMDTNAALLREQEKSSRWEARTTELSNRVEELEIILSEYFINTAYLDQLRVRKNTVLPSAKNTGVLRDN